MSDQLDERLQTSYRNAWLETTNQLLIAKIQNDILGERILELQKQIEANKVLNKPVQQAKPQEQK